MLVLYRGISHANNILLLLCSVFLSRSYESHQNGVVRNVNYGLKSLFDAFPLLLSQYHFLYHLFEHCYVRETGGRSRRYLIGLM